MKRENKAFTLAEMLIVTAVMVIIAAVLIPVSLRMRLQFAQRQDESLVARVSEAIEEYRREKGEFPYRSATDLSDRIQPFTAVEVRDLLMDCIAGPSADMNQWSWVNHPAEADAGFSQIATSELLYFLLSRCDESAMAIRRLPEKQLTAVYPGSEQERVIVSYNGTEYLLTRFVDSNGIALRYYYKTQWSFPRVVAAGIDREFDTEDDITNY
jgi:prepilin-type N-terminal cleavage/methylation domain-containing protein